MGMGVGVEKVESTEKQSEKPSAKLDQKETNFFKKAGKEINARFKKITNGIKDEFDVAKNTLKDAKSDVKNFVNQNLSGKQTENINTISKQKDKLELELEKKYESNIRMKLENEDYQGVLDDLMNVEGTDAKKSSGELLSAGAKIVDRFQDELLLRTASKEQLLKLQNIINSSFEAQTQLIAYNPFDNGMMSTLNQLSSVKDRVQQAIARKNRPSPKD